MIVGLPWLKLGSALSDSPSAPPQTCEQKLAAVVETLQINSGALCLYEQSGLSVIEGKEKREEEKRKRKREEIRASVFTTSIPGRVETALRRTKTVPWLGPDFLEVETFTTLSEHDL